MNKKIFIAATFAIAACAAGVVTTFSNKTEEEITISENAEALANGESTTEPVQQTCYNTITSKKGCWVMYCPKCDIVPGTDVWYALSSTCTEKKK